ncbi:MAG TPA: alpha-amylase family glycosyl hydrolase [Aggregatilineaceae bacterium]|nr:alpha-amylase family glycosyl hydrolase [Aggregatilineaceae bacterium]
MIQSFGKKNLIVVMVFELVMVTLPAAQLQAQGGLTDEGQALVDQALNALAAIDGASSYELNGEEEWNQEWTGTLNGQAVAGSKAYATSTAQYSFVQTESGPNISQVIVLNYSNEDPINAANAIQYVQNSEVRLVDGTVYVNSAYDEENPDLPALPGRWIKVGKATLTAWPGLATGAGLQMFLDDQPDTLLSLTFNMPIDAIQTAVEAYATDVTSAANTLDDGSTAEAITITFSAEGWLAIMPDFTTEGAISAAVSAAVTEDPFKVTLTLDESGQLVGIGLETSFTVNDLDVGGLENAPDGMLLTITSREVSQYTVVEKPVETVAAPDLKAPEELVEVPEVVEQPWWNDRVFYEIFVRSFYDWGGDGIGDLQGVIQKLDYLNDGDPNTTDDLGITGIWLMPIMQSPSYHGYDVTDYYTVEEDYGTNEDFKQLVEEAHKRGIAVIVDLVLNHTSSQHPWFLASRDGDPDYADWYIWSETDPAQIGPWGQDVWYPAGGRYYFALFWEGMPDLNYRTPAVNEQMDDVIRFWLEDMGADGFRLDAIKHLIEDGNVMANSESTLAWLEGFHSYVDALEPDAFTVGEVMGDASQILVQYTGNRVDTTFEFNFASAVIDSVNRGNSLTIVRNMGTILNLYPPGQYSIFLTNHDQNRIMSQFFGDLVKGKLAASILLTSPGVPFIYYGEEIGMTGTKPDEQIRTPMQWDVWYQQGGFTDGKPWEAFNPAYQVNNVALMNEDPDSLLNHYRALIHVRNDHPALRTGAMMILESGDPGVYAFLRFTEDEVILVVINLSTETISGNTLNLDASPLSGPITPTLLLGEGEVAAPTLNEQGGLTDYVPFESLPPQSTFIVQLQ